MQDYQPNSHKYRNEQAEKGEERKRAEKVVTGKVKVKKKSEVSKLADIFISEDAANVKYYVFFDVLVPAIKKAISDIVIDSIDMILYGGSGRSKKRSSNSNASYVSYRNYSDRRDDRHDDRYRSRSRYAFDDIILETRGEAEDVLDGLDAVIETYGMARVADLYDLVGMSFEHTDCKYGWTNLSKAEVLPVRGGGYMIKLPNPMPIG